MNASTDNDRVKHHIQLINFHFAFNLNRDTKG